MFARFLADELGEQFTADMATAWQTAAAAILAVVEARVKEKLIAESSPSAPQTSVRTDLKADQHFIHTIFFLILIRQIK